VKVPAVKAPLNDTVPALLEPPLFASNEYGTDHGPASLPPVVPVK
jgi:hypothetical protein